MFNIDPRVTQLAVKLVQERRASRERLQEQQEQGQTCGQLGEEQNKNHGLKPTEGQQKGEDDKESKPNEKHDQIEQSQEQDHNKHQEFEQEEIKHKDFDQKDTEEHLAKAGQTFPEVEQGGNKDFNLYLAEYLAEHVGVNILFGRHEEIKDRMHKEVVQKEEAASPIPTKKDRDVADSRLRALCLADSTDSEPEPSSPHQV